MLRESCQWWQKSTSGIHFLFSVWIYIHEVFSVLVLTANFRGGGLKSWGASFPHSAFFGDGLSYQRLFKTYATVAFYRELVLVSNIATGYGNLMNINKYISIYIHYEFFFSIWYEFRTYKVVSKEIMNLFFIRQFYYFKKYLQCIPVFEIDAPLF